MTSPTNAAFLMLSKRAETSARDTLISTFVDVGPLFALLSSRDHQILFGRRGTGKTHALSYLASDRERAGDAVAIVDLRNIGSNGGLYADASRPLQERATGLLVDVLSEIHEALYRFFVSHAEVLDLAEAGPALDALAEAITQVKVTGQVEQETKAEESQEASETDRASFQLNSGGFEAAIESGADQTESRATSRSERRTGTERLYVNFGSTGAGLVSTSSTAAALNLRRWRPPPCPFPRHRPSCGRWLDRPTAEDREMQRREGAATVHVVAIRNRTADA